MTSLDDTDRRLLNRLQEDLPLTPAPMPTWPTNWGCPNRIC